VTEQLSLRVSVATVVKVLFENPGDSELMLALERKATILSNGVIITRAQPFGGGIRILNPSPLQEIIGEIQFDSEQSQREQDFRILIPPSKWELVKQYCLHQLENPNDTELESLPHRELVEEFEETLNVDLKVDQYTVHPTGFVIENSPVPTDNIYVMGLPTVRIYRIFEVHIVENALCTIMLRTSERFSNQDLRALALQELQNGGRGFANCILTLPLDLVLESYRGLPPEMRYGKIIIENHELDQSVLAILNDIDVPQYQRL